jgi:transcriptional regulator with XRE-family HTH domain
MRHRLASTPLPDPHFPSDPQRVGRVVAAARKEIGMLQRTLASRLGVSERSMQRLERGESPPGKSACLVLAEILSGASDETWNALVEALELPIEPPPVAAPVAVLPAPPHPPINDVVRALADDLDVPASALRAAFDALLGEIEGRELSVSEARALVMRDSVRRNKRARRN